MKVKVTASKKYVGLVFPNGLGFGKNPNMPAVLGFGNAAKARKDYGA